jgi:hypothetical protein
MQKKGIYISGAFGGNCHHCAVDVDIDPGLKQSERTGQERAL